MNVGLMIYGQLETLTGGYLYDREMVAALERRGHRVAVVRLPEVRYPGRLALNLSLRRLARCLPEAPDLLLQDELCHPSLIMPNHHRRRGRPPVVTVVHQVLCDEPRAPRRNQLLRLVEKRYLDSVDGFVFNSRFTRDTVWRLTSPDRPHIVAFPGGDRLGEALPDETVAIRARRPGPLRLLFLGNLIPRKGLLPLLDALAGLPRNVWVLRVAGRLDMDRTHERAVREVLGKRSLENQVRLLGRCEGSALLEELMHAQVFCMPYAYEGFGMAALEARAFGLPVIGSREGATPELVNEGSDGWLVAPGDLQAVRRAVTHLHTDRTALARMSLAARRRFDRHPTWRASMDRLAGFLEHLAISGKGAQAVGKVRGAGRTAS